VSGRSPLATAFTGAALVYAGLAFAKAGRTGLRGPRPIPAPVRAAEPVQPVPPPSLAAKALYAAMLLFGVFVAICGVLLFLSVFLGD
jgi:hypothetical protein